MLTDGSEMNVANPTHWPDTPKIDQVLEPFVKASIMVPNDYVGSVMELCQDKRGVFINMEYLSTQRVMITYKLPLAEILYDFFDALKSRTRGYASLDYELSGYEPADLVKLDILLNGEVVDALSMIVHSERAYHRARNVTEKLRRIIPRQMYEVAMRKDVLAKCYGGDITRKKKLLEKQKEGKKRMKQIGRVEVPKDAFLTVLQVGDD
jgi:GTP-binding protein LepA